MKIVVAQERTFARKKKDWMIEFLSRSDMTYTNPDRADNVYMRNVDGERK